MTKEVRRRAGTGAEHTTFTGAPAEVTVDTTDNRLVVHDGATAGGFPLALESEISVGMAVDGSEPMTGDLDMGGNGLISVASVNGGGTGKYNYIINGNFDIWQRGTVQNSASGYASDDRWSNKHVGSSKSHTQEDFTLGQTDVLGNPKHYSRTVVTSVAGASNYVYKEQAIEFVKSLSGKTATATIWMKADAGKNVAVDFQQHFGTGGSPSTSIYIAPETLTLTTSWQKFSFTVDLPSIAGKTLGTDLNDRVRMRIWFDSGSDWDVYTNSLGQQSGTFDIAHVSLVEGDATGEADPFTYRSYNEELALCQRYYEKQTNNVYAFQYRSTTRMVNPTFTVTKRVVPTIAYSSSSSFSFGAAFLDGFYMTITASYTVSTTYSITEFTADAEL